MPLWFALACRDVPPTDTADPTVPAADADWASTLDVFIEAERAAAGVPGLAAAVVRDGEVAWAGAYGLADAEQGRPVTVDTPFQLASVSKTVIAVAVLQQVEAGALALDADIDDVLPFPVDPPASPAAPVTLDHLLTHTSPIEDRATVWQDLYVPGDSPIPLGDFLAGYLVAGGDDYEADNWSTDPPGTRYSYSNIGAALAAYVVEAATGVDFADGTAETVFAPLGLANTGWRVADFAPDTVAVPHDTDDGVTFSPYGLYGYPDYPDGLLKSSVVDLATFMTVFTAGAGGILDAGSLAALFEEPYPDVAPHQGRILYAEPHPLGTWWGHTGSDYGVTTRFHFDRDTGIGVIVLMNGETRSEAAVQAIEDLLFAAAPNL